MKYISLEHAIRNRLSEGFDKSKDKKKDAKPKDEQPKDQDADEVKDDQPENSGDDKDKDVKSDKDSEGKKDKKDKTKDDQPEVGGGSTPVILNPSLKPVIDEAAYLSTADRDKKYGEMAAERARKSKENADRAEADKNRVWQQNQTSSELNKNREWQQKQTPSDPNANTLKFKIGGRTATANNAPPVNQERQDHMSKVGQTGLGLAAGAGAAGLVARGVSAIRAGAGAAAKAIAGPGPRAVSAPASRGVSAPSTAVTAPGKSVATSGAATGGSSTGSIVPRTIAGAGAASSVASRPSTADSPEKKPDAPTAPPATGDKPKEPTKYTLPSSAAGGSTAARNFSTTMPSSAGNSFAADKRPPLAPTSQATQRTDAPGLALKPKPAPAPVAAPPVAAGRAPDIHAKSREMFQKDQDSGQGNPASFFAADKQRSKELENKKPTNESKFIASFLKLQEAGNRTGNIFNDAVQLEEKKMPKISSDRIYDRVMDRLKVKKKTAPQPQQPQQAQTTVKEAEELEEKKMPKISSDRIYDRVMDRLKVKKKQPAPAPQQQAQTTVKEAEELDEVSKNTLLKYVDKASDDLQTKGENKPRVMWKGSEVRDYKRQTSNRSGGIYNAARKLAGKGMVPATEEAEQIDEISKDLVGRYALKALADRPKQEKERFDSMRDKHKAGDNMRRVKQDKGESEEKYAERKDRLSRRREKFAGAEKSAEKKFNNRSVGLWRAGQRLAKEDVTFSEDEIAFFAKIDEQD